MRENARNEMDETFVSGTCFVHKLVSTMMYNVMDTGREPRRNAERRDEETASKRPVRAD